MVLDFDANRLDAKFLRNTGAVDDFFTILKSAGGGAPPAPTNLQATAGDAQVSLVWTAAPGAATYNVKRGTQSGGPYSPIQTGVTGTSFTDTTVSNGTTYHYVVSGVSSGGQEGPNSNQTSATPSGGGGSSPVHQQTVTGGAGATTTVSSATVTAVANHLYLVSVSSRPNRAVSSVAGLGLTWTRVDAQCAGRDQTGVEVWRAQGTPGASGAVTATLASAPTSSVITVSRYSGTSGVGAVASANSNGAEGSCTGGTDSASYSVNLTTTVAGSLRFGAVATRNRNHTAGAGYTERAEIKQGSGGNTAGSAIEDRTAPGPGAAPVNGTLSGSTDWAVIGVEVKP